MIDCKKYADEILDSITGYGHLAVVSIGDDPASQSYIRGKRKDCERVGFKFTHCAFVNGDPEEEIAFCIETLNRDPDVTGIILQLPVPKGYDAEWLAGLIAKSKDVDGLREDSPFKACTPEGIVYLLKQEHGDLTGKHAVIIGRGKLVGKPLAKMLLDEDMTVTVCHSKTRQFDLDQLTLNADAIIVAIGVPEHFVFDAIGCSTVVVDCGVNRSENGKLCGDVLYSFSDRLTPVPGGVGLLTRAMLIKHVERGGKMKTPDEIKIVISRRGAGKMYHLEQLAIKQHEKIKELESRLAQVERERGAAVRELEIEEDCYNCKYNYDCKHDGNGYRKCSECGECPCSECNSGQSQYKWRGVCAENTKEEK